jgi:hypothetical protein
MQAWTAIKHGPHIIDNTSNPVIPGLIQLQVLSYGDVPHFVVNLEFEAIPGGIFL